MYSWGFIHPLTYLICNLTMSLGSPAITGHRHGIYPGQVNSTLQEDKDENRKIQYKNKYHHSTKAHKKIKVPH